jgi:hypothetical protein
VAKLMKTHKMENGTLLNVPNHLEVTKSQLFIQEMITSHLVQLKFTLPIVQEMDVKELQLQQLHQVAQQLQLHQVAQRQ